MKILTPVLNFLERHVIGILTTIALHLLIITCFLVIKMRTKQHYADNEVVIDFSQADVLQKQIENLQKQVKDQPKQEFIKDLEKQYNVHNVPVNEADQDAQKSVDNMVKDIKGELNINDDQREPAPEKIESPAKNEVKLLEQKPEYTEDAKGVRTFFRGATTISYFLKGRKHITPIRTPAYKCEGGGKVVLNIFVNPRGYIVSLDVNRAESQITDECLVDAAIKSAEVIRFDEKPDAPAKQEGTITFIFIAQ